MDIQLVNDPQLWTLMASAALFCATMTMTPGPNNVLLASSGAHFGVMRTIPHIAGIRLGSTSLHLSVLLGLGALFETFPMLHQALKYAALLYLLHLAYRLVTSPVKAAHLDEGRQPMSLMEAALFQWINPKSWMSTITLCSAFTLGGDGFWLSAVLGVLVFNLVGFPASFTWVFVGAAISKKLNTDKRRRHFNWFMGSLLLVSLPMILR
ncbi:Lysine exporter protein (LYSE/YGGA) [Shewanella sp. MR-4]|uniref:LysE family translocator n=1 Tax=Shewanella sp. (strain MR-4) TaxID=60480 RepID=UPI0000DE1C3D|nr:LysE family transporter [Shewanella sp. MR-4]ABI38828.1 Lysine exporter protein (LYSE/YGGA) [Shewanella sp. MR-4]